ncbi:MAG TPA: hypothetical protein VFJ11_11860 [Gaiellaceae bacterium]|nr:hypothetical protein [Gaiellaceae bacterium]
MSATLAIGEGAPLAEVAQGSGPLPLVLQLAAALEAEGITYCHWKSNEAIARSLTGENDLDLLVARNDAARFAAVLARLGFVHGRSPREAPAVDNFYGFDPAAEHLVHVHAHYQLIIGDDRTKNYRVPIEGPYLRSATSRHTLPLPRPEFEFVVFVIRMTLKYCTWDEIAWQAFRGRRAQPMPREWREYKHLRARVDDERAAAILDKHLPIVGSDLFQECVAVLENQRPLARRPGVARRIERALQPYSRRSRSRDLGARMLGRIVAATSRRLGRNRKSRLDSGGAMIAVIGGDGSGKSTALAALQRWLGSELDVDLVHIGKPTWSPATIAIRAALKALGALTSGAARTLPIAPTRAAATAVADLRPLVWLLCTARDRRRTYRAARRRVARGQIVLCDRHPAPSLTGMEAPLIALRADSRQDGRLVQAMARLEESYHRAIAAPDLLAVLRVDPEIAVKRKRNEPAAYVRARSAAIWRIDWSSTHAHVVDASRPADAVAAELKALVWSTIAGGAHGDHGRP